MAIARDLRIVKNIQALRGIAALLVVFVHIDQLLAGLNLPVFGGGGVDVFFIISGFIMVYTTSTQNVTSWSFIRDRVARVCPLYWLLTLTVFTVALIMPSLLQSTQADWVELAKSLVFIPFKKTNGLVEPVLFVGWSLNYEIFFYVLFAIGLSIPARRGSVAVVAVIIFLVLFRFLRQPRGIIVEFYTDSIMLEFAAGMIIGILYNNSTFYNAHLISASFGRKSTVVAITLGSFIALVVLPQFFPNVAQVVVCGIPAVGIVTGVLILEQWGWSVRSSVVLVLGDASYSIYLTHPFVTQTVQKLISHVHHGPMLTVVSIILTFVVIFVVGYAVHYAVERPSSRAVRKLLGVRRLVRDGNGDR